MTEHLFTRVEGDGLVAIVVELKKKKKEKDKYRILVHIYGIYEECYG